jgi:hypothetical protein
MIAAIKIRLEEKYVHLCTIEMLQAHWDALLNSSNAQDVPLLARQYETPYNDLHLALASGKKPT